MDFVLKAALLVVRVHRPHIENLCIIQQFVMETQCFLVLPELRLGDWGRRHGCSDQKRIRSKRPGKWLEQISAARTRLNAASGPRDPDPKCGSARQRMYQDLYLSRRQTQNGKSKWGEGKRVVSDVLMFAE